MLHGGGSNKEGAEGMTCEDGDPGSPTCLHRYAQQHGFVAVFPDGTRAKLAHRMRTWNAGGGCEGWRCSSGRACEEDVDDIAYFNDLLDDLEGRVDVDTGRVFATGLSNGGAMSHRLGCELSDRIAAVAPVAGGLQLTTTDECVPGQPVAVLDVHGTADPCWKYDGGESDCTSNQSGLAHVSNEHTMSDWAVALGCEGGPQAGEAPADTQDDGTSTTRQVWTGCAAALEHLRVEGGGHTWPSGHQYMDEDRIGLVTRDWGNEVIWDFFQAHGRTTPSTRHVDP